MGAAKPGCVAASRCEVAAAALGSEAAPGRFRCSESLEGFGGRQALRLKHHVPRGPRLSALGSEGESRPLAGDSWENGGPHAPRRHFLTRNYPSRPIRKKGRKETPASGYYASAPEPWFAAPPTAAAGRHAAHAPNCFIKNGRRSAPLSRMRARMRALHAPASRATGAGGQGFSARWSRVGGRKRLRRRSPVAAGGGRGWESRGARESGVSQAVWPGLVVSVYGAGGLRRDRP